MDKKMWSIEDTIEEIDSLVKENINLKISWHKTTKGILNTMKRPNLRTIRIQEGEKS